MPKPEIEEFGRLVIQYIRDQAIRSSDVEIRPNAGSPIAKRWKETIAEKNFEKLVSLVIQDTVDQTIFNLMYAIDNNLVPLHFVSSQGKVVDLAEEGLGELAGWYTGGDSWIAHYSKERYIDDFKDMEKPWEK